MARIIDTSTTAPDSLSRWERDQVYNGMDCCLTAEILSVLLPQLDEYTAPTYAFSRAIQGPALEMRLRGVRIDLRRKEEVIDEYFEQIELLNHNLERIVLDGVGLTSFNWRSNPDLHKLFYDRLGIPPITKAGRPTVNRDALERIESYLTARPIVAHIMAMRDRAKKISVLRTEIDPDGRIRTSYNIAGTSTGRFSSSFSEFGTGGNLQNIEENLRSVFIADRGKKFAKFDGQQIQSRIVGAIEWNLFHDGRYLDICESDDLHTRVAKMCWPKLPWTGDPIKDRKLAEQPFYRHYDYRFMCKKLGHGSNFIGKPPTLAQQAKLPTSVVADFQRQYYPAFPAHLMWHGWVENQIRKFGYLISLGGRKRYFFGRRTEDKTIREAVAYDAQETEAHIVNNGMLNIFRARDAELMMHDHDALTVQYPEEMEDEVVPKILEQLRHPVPLKHGRVLEIPYEAKTGWNIGKYNAKTNPDGLRNWVGGDQRKRSEEVSILDRPLR